MALVRSTKLSLKFSNNCKKDSLNTFLTEYRRVVGLYIDLLWNEKEVKSLLDTSTLNKIDTWLSTRAKQCAGKQSSGIVRGTRQKQKQRLFVIEKLTKEGKLKEAKNLQKIYDETSISKPNLDRIEAQLDGRFFKTDFSNSTSFDGWLVIGSTGSKKIQVPLKKTKHFNRLSSKGKILNSIRLSGNMVCFCFELPENKVKNGNTLGIDIGLKDTLSCSNGQQIGKDKDGHTYQSICNKLAKKKKGSKSFKKAVNHRTNFLHWCVNQIDWSGVSVLQRENIKHLRKLKHNRRNMQSWNYAELFQILDGKACDAGVQINKLSPVYTSQRCNKCGYTKKTNRKGKVFTCEHCGNTMDADLNASLNLSLPLSEISYGNRHQFDNKTGFYWKVDGQEPIVPDVK